MRGRGEQGEKKRKAVGPTGASIAPPSHQRVAMPPLLFAGSAGEPRWKGKNKVRLGKTKQKYKLRNLKEEKCQGIKADNRQIKVWLVWSMQYNFPSQTAFFFALYRSYNHSISHQPTSLAWLEDRDLLQWSLYVITRDREHWIDWPLLWMGLCWGSWFRAPKWPRWCHNWPPSFSNQPLRERSGVIQCPAAQPSLPQPEGFPHICHKTRFMSPEVTSVCP